ncbi:MAG: hypothetical protein FJZ01_03035 [Candidatus Sericytochromatia bacterium]|nr:hypothetical protein [Candidatus Tanganyikabacteria bacterium]
MADVRLNGKPLHGMVIPINPALDRDATKAYLEFRKDGLDSVGLEVKGQHVLLVGKGFPRSIDKQDRLELGSDAARILYAENEVNDFSEGFVNAAQSERGAAGLLGGLAVGAFGAYLASVFGLLTLPVFLSMLIFGVAAAIVGVGAVGAMAGFKAHHNDISFQHVDRLKAPKAPTPES